MVFGNAAWGFRKTPLEEQFQITADMGLLGLEIGIANAPADIKLDVSEEELSVIKGLSEKYGVKMIAAATGNDFTVGDGDINKIKRVTDICSSLGIGMLRIFAGFTALGDMTEAAFDEMFKALTTVCNYAKEKGVIPVIETHGGVKEYDDGVEHIMSTTTDLETLKRIISDLADNAGICYDPANLYAVGIKDPERFYDEIKDRVVYAHFKDFKKLSSGHLIPSFCGDSDMDWDKILQSMKDFDGPVFYEYENTSDIKDGLKRSHKFISERIKHI